MKKVLVAGATGYLGRCMLKQLKKEGFWVRALARSKDKLHDMDKHIDEVVVGNITDPHSIEGICRDIDIVFSSVGITRQKEKFTYMDVDYQGNLNLLREAQKENIQKFIYVSVLNAHKIKNIKIIEAKELFVKALQESKLDHVVVRPSGFFSDMLDYLKMAKAGRVYLFGDGECKINPIDGSDVAFECVRAMGDSEQEINLGGPTIYSHNDIAELAFTAVGKKKRVSHIPIAVKNIILFMMKIVTPVKVYGPFEFLSSALTMDMVGNAQGNVSLEQFFKENI